MCSWGTPRVSSYKPGSTPCPWVTGGLGVGPRGLAKEELQGFPPLSTPSHAPTREASLTAVWGHVQPGKGSSAPLSKDSCPEASNPMLRASCKEAGSPRSIPIPQTAQSSSLPPPPPPPSHPLYQPCHQHPFPIAPKLLRLQMLSWAGRRHRALGWHSPCCRDWFLCHPGLSSGMGTALLSPPLPQLPPPQQNPSSPPQCCEIRVALCPVSLGCPHVES